MASILDADIRIDFHEVMGSFKVALITFTSSGTTGGNVSDTITLPFKKVFHVLGASSALVGNTWAFTESTQSLSVTVLGGTKTTIMVFGL